MKGVIDWGFNSISLRPPWTQYLRITGAGIYVWHTCSVIDATLAYGLSPFSLQDNILAHNHGHGRNVVKYGETTWYNNCSHCGVVFLFKCSCLVTVWFWILSNLITVFIWYTIYIYIILFIVMTCRNCIMCVPSLFCREFINIGKNSPQNQGKTREWLINPSVSGMASAFGLPSWVRPLVFRHRQ